MKKQIGIWMDSEEAIIIDLNEKGSTHTPIKNGRKSAQKANTKENQNSSLILSGAEVILKEEPHVDGYQKDIFEKIKFSDEWYLFGPDEMKHEFEQYLMRYHAAEFSKIKGIQNAGYLTKKEMIKRTQEFFETAL